MTEGKNSWAEHSKLVLKELERLNEHYGRLRIDMDTKFSELNSKITEIKNIESKVISNTIWIEKVNEVWSPSQMQSAKDEIYKQKNKWTAAIAIITFIQVMVGMAIAIIIKN